MSKAAKAHSPAINMDAEREVAPPVNIIVGELKVVDPLPVAVVFGLIPAQDVKF